MEDGVFPSDSMFGNLSDNNVDFDLMDELLSEGCWLETMGGSDFLQRDLSGSTFFDPPYLLPSSEINNGDTNPNLLDSNTQEDTERSVIADDTLSVVRQTQNSVQSQSIIQNPDRTFDCSDQPKWYSAEWCSEPSRSLWIEPRAYEGPGSFVRDRLFMALQKMKDTIDNGDVLIQIWVPVKRGDKQILTTNDQPFSLDGNSQRLANYRNVSTDYHFSAEEDSNDLNGSTGLPGRVFSQKVPEWTPDVQYFSDQEYPRVGHARMYDVHGTVALPIFEHGSRSCLGVLEVVMTTPKIKYRNEFENICKALETVDLRSSDVSGFPHVKAFNESHRAALPEILEVLNAACETHKLPLAQTWVPCIQQGKGGRRHSEENYVYCVSTVDSACCVSDPEIQEFHEACSEHHLIRGQGIVGRALMTNQPCFSTDITATFTRREYPLAHYAKMFHLRGAVAIRLRSIYSGKIDYVLEFFLPVDCRDFEEQKKMLDSLSTIIQQVCRSLRVVTVKELEEEAVSQVGKDIYMRPPDPLKASSQLTGIDHIMETQRKGKGVQTEEVSEGFNVTSDFGDSKVVLHQQQALSEFTQHDQDSMPRLNVECDGDSSFGEGSFSSVAKPAEKRRTKTEKSISLQVLQRYFAGSLKDAAKSIGVCPTTLKRICRQHGITRWPSRKIKKVGHSLRKLQVVIDSVHGAEGAFQIGSFYKNFPELTSPNLSGSNPFSTPKANDDPNSVKGFEDLPSPLAAECVSSPIATTSKSPSSSCSQSSNSSLYCSNGKQQNPITAHLAGSENATMVNILKRARSDAELCASVQEDLGLMARSQSHKSLREHPILDSLLALPKASGRSTRDKAAVRVKVAYGEEKVRFSMQSYWRFVDLQREIAKRFNIDDMSRIDLKYLDDDSEWVLLTCDADVEECIDVYRSSNARTVKLSVHQVSPLKLGSSFGSRGSS